MNFYVGIDIEHTERFLNSDERFCDEFLNKIFTDEELEYCLSKENPPQHLAGRFAAKEAAFKALEQIESVKKINITQIEVLRPGGSDPPEISGPGMENISSSLSISHTTDIAIALVFMLEENSGYNDR